MSRLARKHRTDIIIKSKGGMSDLFDNVMKEIHRINDDEYDYIADKMTPGELDLIITESLSFGEKRQLLTMIDKYLKEYNDTIRQ